MQQIKRNDKGQFSPGQSGSVEPVQKAFQRTLDEIRDRTNDVRIHAATDKLELLSYSIWPDTQNGVAAIIDRWHAYKMTGLESRLSEFLHMNLGKSVDKEAIFNHLYFDFPEADMPMPKIVDVMICHIRKRLAQSPYVINTVWGSGYRMELRPT